mmetsp:Transcript_119744/g.346106  ORF Transcript_119744/g.346106 Transcript_119744/m.346106 type:complete len:274 (-) Transcript_119744:215-1036(-)
MWWLVAAAGLYVFRGKIAQRLAPYLPAMNPQMISYYGHSCTLFTGIVYVMPIEFLGLGTVKRVAYMMCLWSAVLTAVMAMKANYGSPPLPEGSPFAMVKGLMSGGMPRPLQEWMQKAMTSIDFHFLFFAVNFVTAYPSIIPVLILGRRSLWTVGTHCSKTPEAGGRLWAMFKPRWEMLKAREEEVLLYSALGEILLAFWLTASLLLPTRQFLCCFLYWHYLKIRYMTPRSHKLHDKAWRQLGQQVAPVLKVAPFLQKPIDMAKGWFPAPPVQQ